MRIPLPKMMRHWREREFAKGNTPWAYSVGLKTWAYLAKRPKLYHAVNGIIMPVLALLGRRRGYFRRLPMATGWTRHRDLPAPQGRTFQQRWRAQKSRSSG